MTKQTKVPVIINKIDRIEVHLQTDPNMTLWHAIKLRIASPEKIAALIQESFEKTLQYTDANDVMEYMESQGMIQ